MFSGQLSSGVIGLFVRADLNSGRKRLFARTAAHTSSNAVWIVSGWQSCLDIDLFSGDGVVEFQILGVQEISSIAGEAGKILKRLAG